MIIRNDEKITVSGWYGYLDHPCRDYADCFIPFTSCNMFFKKGQRAPMLGSCEHEINWYLKKEYNKNDF